MHLCMYVCAHIRTYMEAEEPLSWLCPAEEEKDLRRLLSVAVGRMG